MPVYLYVLHISVSGSSVRPPRNLRTTSTIAVQGFPLFDAFTRREHKFKTVLFFSSSDPLRPCLLASLR